MTGTIFIEQLKRSWRTMLGLGVTLAILAIYVSAVVQDADVLIAYRDLLGQMPAGMLAAFGLSDASTLATADGFIGFAFFTYGAFIMAAYGVVMGLNITVNDEDDGIMDVILSLPLPRWRVIVEKVAAYSLIILGICGMAFIGLLIGSRMIPEEMRGDIDLLNMFMACLNLFPLTLAIIGFTVFVASLIGRKHIVAAIAGTFVFGSYFLQMAADAASESIAGFLGKFSIFTYFDGGTVAREGLNAFNVVLLIVVALILVTVSLFTFERRDIG